MALLLLLLLQDVELDVLRLGHADLAERLEAERRLSRLAPALVDAVLDLDVARHDAEPASVSRLDRLRERLREGLLPLLPPAAAVSMLAPEDVEVLAKVRTISLRVEAQGWPLADLIDHVREITGLNIHLEVPDPGVRVDATGELPLDAFLERLLKPRGLAFGVRDGVVWIRSAAAPVGDRRLELYDVQDLTYGLDGPGIGIVLDPIETEGEVLYTGDDLARELRRVVGPEVGGERLVFQNGLLIVRATAAAHAAVSGYLLHLRTLREWKRLRVEGLYADLDRAEVLVPAWIDALRRAATALEAQQETEDVELRARARSILGGMRRALALPGLRELLRGSWMPIVGR